MRLGLAVMALMLGAGCGAADSAFGADTEDFIDEPTPPGNCSAGTSAEPCPNADNTGNAAGQPCLEPDDCAPGVHCVAPFDGEVGTFECSDQCIELVDEASWCLDAAACCTAGAICRRGLCVLEDGAESSGTAGSDSGGSGSSGSGGSGDGAGTSGSDSGTDTGSDTGAGSSSTGMR